MPNDNLPVLSFESPSQWETWLADNHTHQDGIWLRLFKKGSGEPSVTYVEALDEALCYGWIDGQRNKFDERSYLQKFTPVVRKVFGLKLILSTSHG